MFDTKAACKLRRHTLTPTGYSRVTAENVNQAHFARHLHVSQTEFSQHQSTANTCSTRVSTGWQCCPFVACADSCRPHSAHTIWATVCVGGGGGAVKPENWVSASGRWTHSTGHWVGFRCVVDSGTLVFNASVLYPEILCFDQSYEASFF